MATDNIFWDFSSPAMVQFVQMLEMIAQENGPVLITGRSGAGKDVWAREFVKRSKRHDKRCCIASFPDYASSLIESELFGCVKGSFTGANRNHPGIFPSANGGTIIINEIGDFQLDLQSKLLRVCDDGSLHPVGADKDVTVDVRVVAVTNRNLKKLVRQGKFREDLYFRLTRFELVVPSLYDCEEDILPLARFMLRRHNYDAALSDDAAAALVHHRWRGNIRELDNVLARGWLNSRLERPADTGPIEIRAAHLKLPTSASLLRAAQATVTRHRRHFSINVTVPYSGDKVLPTCEEAVDAVEAVLIREALHQTQGNQVKAKEHLGINRNTLRTKIRKLGITCSPKREAS